MGRIIDQPNKGIVDPDNEYLYGLDNADDDGLFRISDLVSYIKSKLVTVSATPPSSPDVGDIWVDTSS